MADTGALTTVVYDGRTYTLHNGRILLDWTRRKDQHRGVIYHQRDCHLCGTWSNASAARAAPTPCRLCRKTAHLRDEDGRPVHKTCLEREITAEILKTAA